MNPNRNRTRFPSPEDIDRQWWLADASGQILGRLAATVAAHLRGKNKPLYTPFLDVGDFVVIINAEQIRLTGNKLKQKEYFNYSGYPGGMRRRTAEERMATEPAELVRDAVEGMLPHNRLGRRLIRKLKVYAGPEHPHAAQCPRTMDLTGVSRPEAGVA